MTLAQDTLTMQSFTIKLIEALRNFGQDYITDAEDKWDDGRRTVAGIQNEFGQFCVALADDIDHTFNSRSLTLKECADELCAGAGGSLCDALVAKAEGEWSLWDIDAFRKLSLSLKSVYLYLWDVAESTDCESVKLGCDTTVKLDFGRMIYHYENIDVSTDDPDIVVAAYERLKQHLLALQEMGLCECDFTAKTALLTPEAHANIAPAEGKAK